MTPQITNDSPPPSTTTDANNITPEMQQFPFVDPSIGRILLCPPRPQQTQQQQEQQQQQKRQKTKTSEQQRLQLIVELDKSNNTITNNNNVKSIQVVDHEQEGNTPINVEDLIPLAWDCDDLLFESSETMIEIDSCSPPLLQAFLEFAKEKEKEDEQIITTPPTTKRNESSFITIATLLALNSLESAIRKVTHQNTEAGRAPLLKQMLQQLTISCHGLQDDSNTTTTSESSLSVLQSILQCMLLPTGLNLRNLMWHGFLGSIPRPWLSLVLIMTYQLEALLLPQQSRILAAATTTTTITEQQQQQQLADISLRKYHPRLAAIVDLGSEIRQRFQNQNNARDDNYIQLIRETLIPTSHLSLWDFCVDQLQWYPPPTSRQQRRPQPRPRQPIIASIVLVVLLEHILRLLYCQVNPDRHLDRCARPGYFYITLDGHGQRHQHDLLLHPFQLNHPPKKNNLQQQQQTQQTQQQQQQQQEKSNDDDELPINNNLVAAFLSGSLVALLSDLFVSGTGGPNVRAAMAHGLWDSWMEQELLCNDDDNDDRVVEQCWEVVDVLLVTLQQLAIETLKLRDVNAIGKVGSTMPSLVDNYRPCLSFTSSTLHELESVRVAFNQLHQRMSPTKDDPTYQQFTLTTTTANANTAETLQSLSVVLNKEIEKIQNEIVKTLLGDNKDTASPKESQWTAQDVYREHETNKLLEPIGATRTLLKDIANATLSFVENLQDAQQQLLNQQENSIKSRQRKSFRRIISCASFVRDLYSFAFYVALLSLQEACCSSCCFCTKSTPMILSRMEYVKIVERTRMVVSTVDRFIVANADRSFKAADQYMKGKIVKKIISDLNNSS